MQITLNQDEILVAIEEYVRKQIVIAKNQKIEIDLKAGRGENGFTATLDIRPAVATATGVTRISAEAITSTVKAAMVEEAAEPEVEATISEDSEDEAVEPEATDESDEAPAPKPASIFNFAKPAE